MSAPVDERRVARKPSVSVSWEKTGAKGRAATIPAQRGAERHAAPARKKSADKAYAKRDDRLRRLVGAPRRKRTAAPAGRTQFVLLIMALLVTGLVATLWLSTAAAGDSYRLQSARTAARDLTERSERLHREVAAMEAPTALAQRANEMGMVRVQDPARIVVAPDGSTQVVGVPQPAAHPAAPSARAATPPAESQLAADAQAQQDAPGPGNQAAGNQAAGGQPPANQAGAGNEDGNTTQAAGGAG
jgi:cell division protein FtsI (penicillin-binding protein 3)